jgi:hypothetical protein
MFRKLLAVASLLLVSAAARADISAYVEPVYEGFLFERWTTYVFCYDLMVEITGEDAWTVAGGVELDEPWITLTGGRFFQYPFPGVPGEPPPCDPAPCYDWLYDSFYTAPPCWPNTDEPCMGPQFAYGPYDTDTELVAAWFWVPDGNDYPGNFTIARFTIIPQAPAWEANIDILVGSREVVPPIRFQAVLEGTYDYPHGDLDHDQDVDLSDLAQLLANYGTTSEATYWDGDLDGDDDVDLEDLAELLSVYGTIRP